MALFSLTLKISSAAVSVVISAAVSVATSLEVCSIIFRPVYM